MMKSISIADASAFTLIPYMYKYESSIDSAERIMVSSLNVHDLIILARIHLFIVTTSRVHDREKARLYFSAFDCSFLNMESICCQS